MVKYDPCNHEASYKKWVANGAQIDGINPENADLLRIYLQDMSIGSNVSPSAKKGARSYGRLRNLKGKIQTLTMIFEQELKIQHLSELEKKETEILILFKRMKEGEIMSRKNGGKPIKATGTFVKVFKAFWHWYQRTQRRKSIDVRDVTIDLDGRDEKPAFCYFTIEDLKKMCDNAKYEYKVLMMFLFDTGIRAPTELMNVKVSDLEWDETNKHYSLNIRQETSKTFGRRIKLMLCSEILRDYLKRKKIEPDSFIFTKRPYAANRYLKALGNKVLGIGNAYVRTFGTRKYHTVDNGITLYDFRHSAACYWLPRYKSESALKYRFGWKKSDMIHYYTELLGMKDTIQEDDLYLDVSKTALEKQIQDKSNNMSLMQEEMKAQSDRIKEQDDLIKQQNDKMQEVLSVLKAIQLERQVKEKVIQSPS